MQELIVDFFLFKYYIIFPSSDETSLNRKLFYALELSLTFQTKRWSLFNFSESDIDLDLGLQAFKVKALVILIKNY